MKNNTHIWTIVLVILAVMHNNMSASPSLVVQSQSSQPSVVQTQPIVTASYVCDTGKTIMAAYYQGTTQPTSNPDQPPVPGGSVVLTLSDGRSMMLAQTISADGARYSNTDGSIVFWNKGNGIMFTENNQETYTGCIAVVSDPGGLPQVYESSAQGFSLRYPSGYTVDSTYTYQELGPGKEITGTKFTIPASLATGTNLSSDSYLSVEEIPKTSDCSASLFLPLNPGSVVKTMVDNGTTYSVGNSDGAGAGNRYDETVYVLPGTNPCIAVRYFIHYSAIQNYPPGMVAQFNEQSLITQFDQIRRTLTINQ